MRRLLPMLFLFLPLFAQPPQGGRGPRNLKILKPEELRANMMLFTRSLGVRCDFCHVADRASDENPHKTTARMMLTMVREINAKFPDGQTHVTCYTCHRGSSKPEIDPPAAPPPPPPAQ